MADRKRALDSFIIIAFRFDVDFCCGEKNYVQRVQYLCNCVDCGMGVREERVSYLFFLCLRDRRKDLNCPCTNRLPPYNIVDKNLARVRSKGIIASVICHCLERELHLVNEGGDKTLTLYLKPEGQSWGVPYISSDSKWAMGGQLLAARS